jgi:hypothetical protein
MEIRHPEDRDVAGMARVHGRAWRRAYAELLPDGALDGVGRTDGALAGFYRARGFERVGTGEYELGGRSSPTVVDALSLDAAEA